MPKYCRLPIGLGVYIMMLSISSPSWLLFCHIYFPCAIHDLDLLALITAMGESSDSASYIRMVQHLIEKCLIFNMNKDECIEALSKHANIKPVITSTVWQELEKENREFFRAYKMDKEERVLEMDAMQRIQKMLAESASRDPDDD